MIAHVDADAFFASALQRKFPKLRGKPLLALGMGGGCVIAASYEAKAFGVKTGMRFSEAKALCPEAISMPSDFEEALLASEQIESVLRDQCPIIEQMSVDEWYMDLSSLVGGTPANLQEWAKSLQEEVRNRTALTVSIGVSSSKLLAKMAGEWKKPAGVTVLENTIVHIEQFLRERPAEAIPGIGRKRSLHSQSHGWKTAWDIATADTETIVHLFGRPGRDLQRELLGECLEKVEEDTRPPQSISRCRSFPPTRDRNVVFAQLLHHLTYIMLKMRRQNLACRMITVWLRDDDYEHVGKAIRLPQPVDTEERIFPYLLRCFQRLYATKQRYTQIGLALSGLAPRGAAQYSLFEDTTKVNEGEQVQQALDILHERFGREIVKRGSAMAVQTGQRKKLSIVN